MSPARLRSSCSLSASRRPAWARRRRREKAEGPAWEDKPYNVVDGKVDMPTYNGYRRYDNSCLRCHGPDGAGSSYAPALVNSLKQLSYEKFVEIVIYGKKNVSTSQQLVMPAFGEVEDVVNNLDDIYTYLKARSDGVVGRGRPERMAQIGARCGNPEAARCGSAGRADDARAAALAGLAAAAWRPMRRAQVGELVDRTKLRVCADPGNLPFSNQAGEGFENRIAELLARQARGRDRLHLVSAEHGLRAQHAQCRRSATW